MKEKIIFMLAVICIVGGILFAIEMQKPTVGIAEANDGIVRSNTINNKTSL